MQHQWCMAYHDSNRTLAIVFSLISYPFWLLKLSNFDFRGRRFTWFGQKNNVCWCHKQLVWRQHTPCGWPKGNPKSTRGGPLYKHQTTESLDFEIINCNFLILSEYLIPQFCCFGSDHENGKSQALNFYNIGNFI